MPRKAWPARSEALGRKSLVQVADIVDRGAVDRMVREAGAALGGIDILKATPRAAARSTFSISITRPGGPRHRHHAGWHIPLRPGHAARNDRQRLGAHHHARRHRLARRRQAPGAQPDGKVGPHRPDAGTGRRVRRQGHHRQRHRPRHHRDGAARLGRNAAGPQQPAARAAQRPRRRDASAALFLAQPEQGYLTGQIIHVNGGAYLGT